MLHISLSSISRIICMGMSPSVLIAPLVGSGLMKYNVGNPRTCNTNSFLTLSWILSNINTRQRTSIHETVSHGSFKELTLQLFCMRIKKELLQNDEAMFLVHIQAMKMIGGEEYPPAYHVQIHIHRPCQPSQSSHCFHTQQQAVPQVDLKVK